MTVCMLSIEQALKQLSDWSKLDSSEYVTEFSFCHMHTRMYYVDHSATGDDQFDAEHAEWEKNRPTPGDT